MLVLDPPWNVLNYWKLNNQATSSLTSDCCAKRKGSICLFYKLTDTAFWLCGPTCDCWAVQAIYDPKSMKTLTLNPLAAKIFNLNFHPLEVVSRWRDPQLQVSEIVSRWRDPQLQVSENYSDLTKWRSTVFKSCWLMSHFILNEFKMWYIMWL